MKNGWLKLATGLQCVSSFTVSRCYFTEVTGKIVSCSLHGFGDASSKAYAAVMYLHVTTTTGSYVKFLSRLHTSKFSLTSVIDNVHMLMCMNDKFSLTSLTLTSFTCWCERINKFSLTSFHCSQQYIYTADENKNNHEAPISFFHRGSRLFNERKKGAGLWS